MRCNRVSWDLALCILMFPDVSKEPFAYESIQCHIPHNWNLEHYSRLLFTALGLSRDVYCECKIQYTQLSHIQVCAA